MPRNINMLSALQQRAVGDGKAMAEFQNRMEFIQEELADAARIIASRKTAEEIAARNAQRLLEQRREVAEKAAERKAAELAASIAAGGPQCKRTLVF